MKKLVVCLVVLLMVGQSCQKQPKAPKEVLTHYFLISNKVVTGDTSEIEFLKKHLSKSATNAVQKVPLLLEYSLLAITRKGQLSKVEIKGQNTFSKDSLVFNVDLIYQDKFIKNINQSMVYENGAWRLSVSAP